MAFGTIILATELNNPELLRPVLESAVVHPISREIIKEEVEEILAAVPRTAEQMERKYTLVAWSAPLGKALGMMSLIEPNETMRAFAESSNPIELANAYVHRDARGLGVGRALVRGLEARAREQGHSEIILNSGPRYMLSGWPFWRRMYGDPIGVAGDYYPGPRGDAPVWRKPL